MDTSFRNQQKHAALLKKLSRGNKNRIIGHTQRPILDGIDLPYDQICCVIHFRTLDMQRFHFPSLNTSNNHKEKMLS